MPGAASKWICPVGYAYLNPTLPDDLTLIGRYCRRVPVSDLDPSPFEVVIDDPTDPVLNDVVDYYPDSTVPLKTYFSPGPWIAPIFASPALQNLLTPPKDCGCGCKGAGTCAPLGKTKKKAGLALLALLLL